MKINKDFILRNIAGQDVLVATGKAAAKFNGLLTISEVGTFIWQNIEKAASMEELIEFVLEEFEVDRATAEEDVNGFTEALAEQNLFIYDDPDAKW